MSVGVGDQCKAVQGGETPVHRRVRGETSLKRMDIGGEILKALFDGVKAGKCTKQ